MAVETTHHASPEPTAAVGDRAMSPTDVADLLHELRTPLGGIDAVAELLGETGLSTEQLRLVDALKAAAFHLRALAGSVLDAAAHQPEPWLGAEATLVEALAPFVALSEARARRQGLAFDSTIEPVPLTSLPLPTLRLRQMIENLVDNAVKVTPQGSVALSIEVDGPMLHVRVCDSGPGFRPGDLDRLFTRRMQVAEGPKGTGIGLSLIKRFATEAGGAVVARNLPVGGAEVGFSMPLRGAPAETALAPVARVLVVEDSVAGRMLMRAMLESFGFGVDVAVGGGSAIDLIARTGYDLITVDRTLGDIDGVELTRVLTDRLGAARRTRIVAVTGRIDEADRVAFMMAGADAFLPKPISPRMLAEMLARLGLAKRAAA
jgi:CheY-like chemotaxis protein